MISPLRSFSNGKKQKRFNHDWFKNEDWKSWLHYKPEKDAAFCSTCINATACGDICAPLSTTFNEARSVNRQNLLKILLNVKFLARQALSLRGHGSGEDFNFTQFYILR